MSDVTKKLKQLEADIEKIAKESANKTTMLKLGNLAVSEIQKNTRLGYGVNSEGGPRGKLRDLKPRYKKQRKKDRAKLDSTTSPNKSNLTRTGEMLKSIYAKFKKAGHVVLSFKGKHKDTRLSNAQLAAIHDEGLGKMPKRPFFRLTKTGEDKVRREARSLITNEVNKRLTQILRR